MSTLQGKLAVVTGAGSGIGRELVFGLVDGGADVALCDIDSSGLESTATRARRRTPEALVTTHTCDVAQAEAVADFAVGVAEGHSGRAVDLLFNNAATVGGGSFVEDPPADWERTFDVCWRGTYLCTRAFLPMLLRSERGAVVNVASVNALWASLGGPPHSAYSTAKFAVRGFTESLIDDFRRNAPHLSAMLVLPGQARTGMPAPPRTWGKAIRALGADVRPMTARDAAERILAALGSGQWRLVLGDDACAVDEHVRTDPSRAYDLLGSP